MQRREKGKVLMGTGYKVDDNGPSQRMKSNITMCAMCYLHKLQRTWHHLHFSHHKHKPGSGGKKAFHAAKLGVGVFNFTQVPRPSLCNNSNKLRYFFKTQPFQTRFKLNIYIVSTIIIVPTC